MPRSPAPQTRLAWPLTLGLLFLLTACVHTPTASERARVAQHLVQLAGAPARAHDVSDGRPPELLHRALAQDDPAALAQQLVPLLSGRPDIAAQAAFDLGASGAANAAELIGQNLPAGAPAEAVAAAAMGLVTSKSDATEHVLLALAARPSHPPEALEALFVYYRGRGAAKLPAAVLPDPGLLAYASHPTPRGRAALPYLARAVRDPALVPVLADLAARDPDFEVRRAAVFALAEGLPKHERTAEVRAVCLQAIAGRIADSDPHVVIAACRAASSYDDPRAVELLTTALAHADFNVRVAALDGLGRRKAKSVEAMLRLARSDPSVSVRHTAAEQLVALDPAAAQPLADLLLADPSEYVRSAGVDVLAKSKDPGALLRVAQIAKSDPHVRVRETAVGAFEGQADSPVAKEAIRTALADADPEVVATACGVVEKNLWKDFVRELTAIPGRFTDCKGADASEASLAAIAALDADGHRALFEAHRHDPNPNVRAAAEKALATLDHQKSPKLSRGADTRGTLLPGGAPVFDRDVFLLVETDQGTMKIRLFPEQAPIHCAHVAALARAGFYDGLNWHRVVPDFVIQGGCPRGDGSGGAGVTLPLEPTRIAFQRGTLGMPRSEHPDSGGCQLFICHSRAPNLDVAYTAFGQVVEGLEVIDRIDVGSKILHVRVTGVR